MEFSIGSLELNRSNPAHIGTKPLSQAVSSYVDGSENKKGSFETFLMDAVNRMNSQSG